ncbi:MAG: arginase family protein [Gammaproteobacteria bacterium]|nr:arginase family protein [Gammaproteobacteria bacterium]
MERIAVPFFIGEPMRGFRIPEPHRTINPTLPQSPPQQRMAVLYRALADEVARIDRPCVYAGDCLATIGVLAGLQRRGVSPTVVWFDAHGDFHTWETTPSGFLGGMPLAMLVGRGERTIMAGAGATPIDEHQAILVDGRDLDPGEPVDSSELLHVSVDELQGLLPEDAPLYVHIDVDVVDPTDMPAVNYPSPGGPSLEAVASSLRSIASTGRVVACSISSWNPALPEAETAAAATETLVDALA